MKAAGGALGQEQNGGDSGGVNWVFKLMQHALHKTLASLCYFLFVFVLFFMCS